MDANPREGTFKAVTLVATVMVGAVLYLAREVFIPFALALLLTFLLAPLVIRLRRLRIPRVPAVVTVVTFAGVVIAAVGWLVSVQLYDLADKLPNYQATIQRKLRSITLSGNGIFNRASKMIKETGKELSKPAEEAARNEPPDQSKPIPVEVHTPKPTSLEVLQRILGTVVNPLATAGIVAIFVIFMLIYREEMRDKFLRLVGMGKLNVTTQALNDAAGRVSRFLVMNLVVNVTYGIPIGMGLYFIGVPNAILWGLMATLLRFIPYLGPWIAAAFPLALAIAVDPGWTMLIETAALFIVVELISNNVVEPWLYGTSTGLSPVAVIVAAVFWTWLWGPVGLFLSTPLTVCLVVIGRHFPQLDFFYILLADEPVLTPEMRFYQRLVARDPDEASELTTEFLKERPLVAMYDEMVLPALSLAEFERQKGTLHETRQQYILQNTRAIVDELADHADVQRDADGKPLDKLELPPKPTHVSVVCMPTRDDADEVAACILAQLLERRGIGSRAVPANPFTPACMNELRELSPQVICICTLTPPTWRRARYIIKRIRGNFPEAKLVVNTWGAAEEPAEVQSRLALEASDVIVKTVGDAVDEISSLMSKSEPEAEPDEHEEQPEEALR